MLSLQLNVLTLNVWGIPFVSSDREARIAAIGAELSSGQYDIVSLQEVWSQSDYQSLKEKTEAVLPFSYYFYSGVVGAGLLVLSKYPIIGTLFHAWSVNGYFHRVQHADWFAGKGVGLCQILVGDRVVNLYNAHLHAEYDNENDEYKTHRVIQAFDTAQFIAMTRGDSVLQILAGDLNTQPQDVSYKVLLLLSKMRDCCTTNVITTNECSRNSYTSKRLLARNPHGIRIDHIFMRVGEHFDAAVAEHLLPLPDRVPGHKFSYSDHEAVLVRIVLTARPKQSISSGRNACPAATLSVHANDSVSESCAAPEIGDNKVIRRHSASDGNCEFNGVADSDCAAKETADAAFLKPMRIAVLYEAIALCESSLQQLKVDRVLYYSVAVFVTFLLCALVEYSTFGSFKALCLLLKFALFAVILFCVFMGSLWNFMERSGILSGKTSMEIMLRNIEKYDIDIQ